MNEHLSRILAYTPATIYGHQVPEAVGAGIAITFIILVAAWLVRLLRR